VHLAFRDQRTGRYGSYYKRSLEGGSVGAEESCKPGRTNKCNSIHRLF